MSYLVIKTNNAICAVLAVVLLLIGSCGGGAPNNLKSGLNDNDWRRGLSIPVIPNDWICGYAKKDAESWWHPIEMQKGHYIKNILFDDKGNIVQEQDF